MTLNNNRGRKSLRRFTDRAGNFKFPARLYFEGETAHVATPLPLAIIACMVGCSLPLLFHNLIGPFVTRWGLDNGIITNSVAGPVGTLLIVILVTTPHVPRIHLGAHCHVRTYRA